MSTIQMQQTYMQASSQQNFQNNQQQLGQQNYQYNGQQQYSNIYPQSFQPQQNFQQQNYGMQHQPPQNYQQVIQKPPEQQQQYFENYELTSHKKWFSGCNWYCGICMIIGVISNIALFDLIEYSTGYKVCSLISNIIWEIGIIQGLIGLYKRINWLLLSYIGFTGLSLLVGIIGIIIEASQMSNYITGIISGLISIVIMVVFQGWLMHKAMKIKNLTIVNNMTVHNSL